MDAPLSYGHWDLFLLSLTAASSFVVYHTRPRDWRGWRVAGHFTAFTAAVLVERFGFPLSLYVLTGRLLPPEAAHSGSLDVLGALLVAAGTALVVGADGTRRAAVRSGGFASGGLYACVRHPQLTGLLAVMGGLLLWWPTFVTLVAYPFIAASYAGTSHAEAYDLRKAYGAAYDRYAEDVPAFLPERPRRRTARRRAAARRPVTACADAEWGRTGDGAP